MADYNAPALPDYGVCDECGARVAPHCNGGGCQAVGCVAGCDD